MKVIYSEVDEFAINQNIHTKHISMPFLQSHGHYELYYLLEGERNYFIDDTIYRIETGSIVIVPPQVLHRTIGDKQGIYSRILLDIPESFSELLPICLRGEKCFVYNVPAKRRHLLERLFDNMECEYNKKDKYSERLLQRYVDEMLVLLIRMTDSENFSVTDAETDKVIGSAARYIAENFDKNLTLETVAAELHMSKSYFCKLFRRKTGVGFADYLAGVRITEGARLLAETELNVTEIAMRCGYNDSAYFTAVFKKIKGVTPLKYRKNGRI